MIRGLQEIHHVHIDCQALDLPADLARLLTSSADFPFNRMLKLA